MLNDYLPPFRQTRVNTMNQWRKYVLRTNLHYHANGECFIKYDAQGAVMASSETLARRAFKTQLGTVRFGPAMRRKLA